MRQIVLDTETTGLDPAQGHKVIEIGCVELVNRKLTGNHFHVYINPLREIEAAALEIHGITNTFLADKPLFADVAESFVEFVSGAELVIHNAPFDIGFLNHELAALKKGYKVMSDYCSVLDTLVMARKKHPGQKNNLDALCKRYMVDNTQRELHGALLDAEILADVYLMMTGGQSSLSLGYEESSEQRSAQQLKRLSAERKALKIIRASDEELSAHELRLKEIDDTADAGCMWLKI
ncbi:MAG: DNA polymerase III subunit epsilon [Gammaproteobacteria bacterium]|jgi:DNA polymerase III subunit epsilon|nr:DNA polymerase III subunit epsilon [Gammaproteobacteria bacterium]MBT6041924.1 DNA polymerase III subunit epsilon [Gammaproteobacteria bacterium]